MTEPTIDLPALVDHVDHFQRRVLNEALLDASATYWRRRAAMFEWARPRPTDYPGRATPAERRERDARLAALAQACRNRAEVSIIGEAV